LCCAKLFAAKNDEAFTPYLITSQFVKFILVFKIFKTLVPGRPSHNQNEKKISPHRHSAVSRNQKERQPSHLHHEDHEDHEV
jgi:hypothetical protein